MRLILAFIAVVAVGCARTSDNPFSNDTETSASDDRSIVQNDPQHYFESVAVQALQKTTACAKCHTFPKDGGNGNFRPFQYAYMRNLLVAGTFNVSKSTIDNGVMRYMLGQIPTHAGGAAYCYGALTASPCKEVREWAKQEGLTVADVSPVGGGTPSAAPFGRTSGGDSDGQIWGWAADPDAPSVPMSVQIFVGGPRGSGTLVGAVSANLSFYSFEKSGNVGFRYTLPDMYRDGTSRMVYVYGADINTPGTYHELADSPINATSYLPDPVAKNYYTANVLPFIQNRNCLGCHSLGEFQYDYAFYSLILRPPPHLGGTATTNTFYKKMFGSEAHRGGSPCGGNPAGAPCNYLINTWNQEFN